MQSLELVKSSELIMVFRISKIHTNADFTFSNNISDSIFIKHIVSLIIKCYSKTKGRIPTGIVVCVLNFGRRILL